MRLFGLRRTSRDAAAYGGATGDVVDVMAVCPAMACDGMARFVERERSEASGERGQTVRHAFPAWCG